jgi:hypothetical protein
VGGVEVDEVAFGAAAGVFDATGLDGLPHPERTMPRHSKVTRAATAPRRRIGSKRIGVRIERAGHCSRCVGPSPEPAVGGSCQGSVRVCPIRAVPHQSQMGARYVICDFRPWGTYTFVVASATGIPKYRTATVTE